MTLDRLLGGVRSKAKELTVGAALALAACGGDVGPTGPTTRPPPPPPPPPSTSTITVQARNLTQDGEPIIQGEGDIEYIIGNQTYTSDGPFTLEVTNGTIEIFAMHPDFYKEWGLVKEQGTPRFEYIEQRDLTDGRSRVSVNRDMTLEVYLIRESDLSDLGYTIGDVAKIIDKNGEGQAGTDRFAQRSIILWYDIANSDGTNQSVLDSYDAWINGAQNRNIASITDGYIEEVTEQMGGNQPSQPHMQVLMVNSIPGNPNACGANAGVSSENKINRGVVWFKVNRSYGSSDSCFLVESLQAVGAQGDIDGALSDDVMTGIPTGEYNTFAQRTGKILYHFDPGTRFNN